MNTNNTHLVDSNDDSTGNDIITTIDYSTTLLAPVDQQSVEKSSHLHTPSPDEAQSETVSSLHLLSSKFDNVSEEPDAELIKFFQSCDKDITQDIVSRVNTLVDLIPFPDVEVGEISVRKSMIKKIYFQVLKDMLVGEEKRLRTNNFTTLLSNTNFHKSQIICASEAVLFAFNQSDKVDFVQLLDVFQLEPFELSVVIESFVHHAGWLNSTLKRHFRNVEEKLLDCLVWRSGSVLFSKIENNKDTIPQPHPGSETPLHKKRSRMFSVYSNDNHNDQHNQQPKSTGSIAAVQFFFRKIYRLASQRITDLCTEFNLRGSSQNRTISQDIMRQILNLVWHVLSEKNRLLLDRHVDHIIMCSMYAVCNKVNQMSWVSFREITQNYRTNIENTRTISSAEVGKILLEVTIDSDKIGDLVKFYNNVFIPSLKDFILQSSPKDNTSGIPGEIMQSPSKQIRVSKTAKVFVSPLRSPSARNPQVLLSPNLASSMTPRTRALYSFRDAYTERMNPNSLTSSPFLTASPSAKRALDFSDSTATESPRKFRKLAGAKRSIKFDEGESSSLASASEQNANGSQSVEAN